MNLPSAPRWYTFAAAAGWVALVAVAGFLNGNHGFWVRFGAGLATTAASIAFAVSGLGLAADRWRERRWRFANRTTALIVLETIEVEFAALVDRSYDALYPALSELGLPVLHAGSFVHIPFDTKAGRRVLLAVSREARIVGNKVRLARAERVHDLVRAEEAETRRRIAAITRQGAGEDSEQQQESGTFAGSDSRRLTNPAITMLEERRDRGSKAVSPCA